MLPAAAPQHQKRPTHPSPAAKGHLALINCRYAAIPYDTRRCQRSTWLPFFVTVPPAAAARAARRRNGARRGAARLRTRGRAGQRRRNARARGAGGGGARAARRAIRVAGGSIKPEPTHSRVPFRVAIWGWTPRGAGCAPTDTVARPSMYLGGVAAGYHCEAGPGDAAVLPHSAGGRCAESSSARSICMMNVYVTLSPQRIDGRRAAERQKSVARDTVSRLHSAVDQRDKPATPARERSWPY